MERAFGVAMSNETWDGVKNAVNARMEKYRSELRTGGLKRTMEEKNNEKAEIRKRYSSERESAKDEGEINRINGRMNEELEKVDDRKNPALLALNPNIDMIKMEIERPEMAKDVRMIREGMYATSCAFMVEEMIRQAGSTREFSQEMIDKVNEISKRANDVKRNVYAEVMMKGREG